MTEPWTRPWLYSLAGHIAIALAIFLKAVLIPTEPLELRDAIRVDVVDLPQKMNEMPAAPPTTSAPEPPAPAPEPTPKALPEKKVEAKPPEPNVVVLKKKKKDLKKSQESALKSLKALEALNKIKDDVEQGQKQASAAKIRGSKISIGDSLTGQSRDDFNVYLSTMKQKIFSHWNLPQWLAEADLKAKVLVRVDADGVVISKQLVLSSGQELFDTKAIEAVEASSPLPPPPPELRGVLSTRGVVFNFPQ